jgi:signal transduction histidine kinase/DNA-binding response OmpR family regulator/CHASE3 domain sensor protein
MPTSQTRRTLTVGFGISLAILLITSVASFISIRNLIYSASEVNHTNTVLKELENVISYTKDAETGQRGYLLTGDSVFLQPYFGAREKTQASLDTVRRLTEDNPIQQRRITDLGAIINARFDYLSRSVKIRQTDINQLQLGKAEMDRARRLVIQMQETEQQLLIQRTESVQRFSTFTPVLIIIAALIAVFTTVYFYRKVSESFKRQRELTLELQAKDKDITNRIDIIQGLAAQISKGDYKIRLNEEQSDGLGNLSFSLNMMAASLDHSFTLLGDKEWLQTGSMQLSEKMAGEKTVIDLTSEILNHLASYTNAQAGAFYLLEENILTFQNGYAVKADSIRNKIESGNGVTGQAAESKRTVLATDIREEDFVITFGLGEVRPRSIVAFPVIFEGSVKGVIELGAFSDFTERDLQLFNTIAEPVGIALNTAQNRTRLQELLEETQAQSEELQAQHSELENLNTELEAQAEKLQASEEELKVQQEELMETNSELQERSKLLEEKNDLILQRNLEIQKKSEELALSARYKSEFLANMSHELRTPLNSILLLSRLLGENNDTNLKPEQVEFANVIQSSGNSLLMLIDDILDLSKIESGKMELEYEVVPVSEIARDMQMMFEPMAREKGVEFRIVREQRAPEEIETDKLRLEQIIKNLISNAIKFTEKGSVELAFSAPEELKGYLNIRVTDTGIGIPQEKQLLIFEAFQQADGSTRRKYGGTGLGLSISRQLALLLRGDITLTSEHGKGSTFILSIPVNPSTVEQQQPVEQLSPAIDIETTTPEASLPEPYEFIAGHIPADMPDDRDEVQPGDKVMLIVEDDTGFAHALVDFTRRKGYKAIVAVRGDHGVELARRYLPAGILLDIQLPVKSGWEVMEELKKDKLTRHIPVHIMSSHSVKKQSISLGAIDFINKPVALDQMNSVFEKIEYYLKKDNKQVLIIEDNTKHAEALSYFLSTHNISARISANIEQGLETLQQKEADCVILDMGVPDMNAYSTLESLKKNKGLEHLPVIIFTGKSLSRSEEMRIKQYADSIVVKTAHSYRRILDEVSIFLHLMEEHKKKEGGAPPRMKPLAEILKGRKVLMADDDVRNIFSLTRVLEQHQMQVVPAINGKEALELLKREKDIDIVLMDMMMPEMDGYETIGKIRANSVWKKLPVIAITAKAMAGDREKCIQAGADDYISKPVDMDQLVSLLRIWLYDHSAKRNN